ncbi:MAG: HAD hydrolase-like protein [Desulfurococcaceae archaeon]
MNQPPRECVILIDIDGTIVPNLVDFEKLRYEIRKMIGIDHPLRPLGESLESLPLKEDLKRTAWELIEKEELASIERLRVENVQNNVSSIISAVNEKHKVVLVTIRSSRTTIPLLKKIGLKNYITEVVTRDQYKTRKMQLKYLMDKFNDSTIVFIADTLYDRDVANELGLRFIKVESYRDLPRVLENALNMCEANVRS